MSVVMLFGFIILGGGIVFSAILSTKLNEAIKQNGELSNIVGKLQNEKAEFEKEREQWSKVCAYRQTQLEESKREVCALTERAVAGDALKQSLTSIDAGTKALEKSLSSAIRVGDIERKNAISAERELNKFKIDCRKCNISHTDELSAAQLSLFEEKNKSLELREKVTKCDLLESANQNLTDRILNLETRLAETINDKLDAEESLRIAQGQVNGLTAALQDAQ